MKYSYLVSSLPTLALGEPIPYTPEEFRFHCTGALSRGDLEELGRVLDGRAGEGTSAFARAWHGIETQVRNATARQRAAARGIEARSYLREHPGFDAYVEKGVAEAFAKPNPLERELALERLRWGALEDLARKEPFGLSAVLAFAVRLQIAARWAGLTPEAGRQQFEERVSRTLEERNIRTEFEVDIPSVEDARFGPYAEK